MEIIEKAYETTINNIGKASVDYCNGILCRWFDAGYRTLEEVEAASEQYRHDKTGVTDKAGSFETDDFFEAALRRSYGNED